MQKVFRSATTMEWLKEILFEERYKHCREKLPCNEIDMSLTKSQATWKANEQKNTIFAQVNGFM